MDMIVAFEDEKFYSNMMLLVLFITVTYYAWKSFTITIRDAQESLLCIQYVIYV